MEPFVISRRLFLQGGAALVICLTRGTAALAQITLPGSLQQNPRLDSWLRLNSDGSVSVFSGKVELGQGIATAIAQIAAEELDIDVARVRMETVDTAHSPNEGRTVGSNSMPVGGTAMRHAAADARAVLLANASRELGAAIDRLSVDDGRIHLDGRAQSLTYWDLLANGRFDTEASGRGHLKTPDQYRYIGIALPRLDLPSKFFGGPAYLHDLRLPGMLHARIVRGPAGAELVELDPRAAAGIPGIVEIIRDGRFTAVVAEREEQAVAAAAALGAAAQWRMAALPTPARLRQVLASLPIERTRVHAAAGAGPATVRKHRASYSKPYIAHASMAPSVALAQWSSNLLTVWSHAQGMYPLRAAIARVLAVHEANVRCIYGEGSGCYGHTGADDAAMDAALIARALPGRPIRLQWSRADEFQHEPYGSAMFLDVEAGLDADDRIVDWRYDLLSCTYSTRPGESDSAGHLLAAQEKQAPLPRPRITDGEQPTGGADRNAVPLYAVPRVEITEHLVLENPLRTSALRSLGAYANVFAIESFMDELAELTGRDPFEFRLAHLEDERARAVVEAVRERVKGVPRPTTAGRVGRGLGFARYKNSSTYVAIVADVSVDEGTGVVRFLRAFAAVDVGQVVNPDGVRNQIEGGIVQAASWTLKEAVNFSEAGVVSRDWASYPILRFSEVPEIEVILLDRPHSAFVGAGEASQGPAAAALANALANATGARVRDLPLTPDRVLAALSMRMTRSDAA